MAEYTIPLRKGYHQVPRHKRSKKAVDVLRAYLKRHTKADVIRIGQHLNEHIWQNGIRNPPPRVRVTTSLEEADGVKVANVELFGKGFKESVRPEEKVEEASGLKGKLQQMQQSRDPEPAEKVDEKPDEESEDSKTQPAKKAAAKKAPVKKAAAKKATTKKTNK